MKTSSPTASGARRWRPYQDIFSNKWRGLRTAIYANQARHSTGLNLDSDKIYFRDWPFGALPAYQKRYWCPYCVQRRIYCSLGVTGRAWMDLDLWQCSNCHSFWAVGYHGGAVGDPAWYLMPVIESRTGGFYHGVLIARQPFPANKLRII